MIDVECWMVDSFRIQNFSARAECAFPRDHGVVYYGWWFMGGDSVIW